MSSSYPSTGVNESSKDKEVEQLEEYIHISLDAVEKIRNLDLHEKDERISRNPDELNGDSIENKVLIPLENKFDFDIITLPLPNSKQDKASGPGTIFNKDGIFNFDGSCPQTNLVVFPAKHTDDVIDTTGEIIFISHISRREFILKTLIILSVKLIVTFSIFFTIVYVHAIGNFIKSDIQMFYFICILDVILCIILFSFDEIRKKCPYNYSLMSMFILCNSYLLGYFYIQYTTDKLLFSFVGTFSIFFSVGVISRLKSLDFTTYFWLVDSLITIAILYLITASIFYWITGSHILIYFFFFILVSVIVFMLLHYFQLFFGNGTYQMNKEEDVLSALVMYFQIIVIFATFPKLISGPQK